MLTDENIETQSSGPVRRQGIPFGRLCHVEKMMLMIRAKGGARSRRFSAASIDALAERIAVIGQA